MADVEQTQKMIPFITCKISICQYVCELVLGVNMFDVDLWVQIDSVEQPIKRNSVGSGHMSHCWTSSFDNHLDDSFVVFKNEQLRLDLGRMCFGGFVIHIRQPPNLSFFVFSWCVALVFLIDGVVSCPAQVSLE